MQKQNTQDGHGRGKKRFNDEQAQNDANRRGTGKGGKEREQRARREVSDDELQAQLKRYFLTYFSKRDSEEAEEEIEDKPTKQGPDFKEITELINTTQLYGVPVEIGDVLFHLMSSINDQAEVHLTTYLPQVVDDMVAAKMNSASITRGVSKFMQEISELSTDVPRLPHIFFHSVIRPLMEKSRLNVKDIVWAYENAEDIFSVGGHFKIFAMFL